MRLNLRNEEKLIKHIQEEVFKGAEYKIATEHPDADDVKVEFEGKIYGIKVHLITARTVCWDLYLVIEDEDGGSHGEEVADGAFRL